MHKLLCLLFFILQTTLATGQKVSIDSLTRALQEHPEEDTVRLQILLDLSYDYYMVDPDKGLQAAEEAITLAKKLDNAKGLAAAFNQKGSNHWAKGEDSLGLVAGEEALKIHRDNNNKLGIAKALNNLALNYYNLSNFKKALQYHDEALAIFTEVKFTAGVVHSYGNAGVVYLALSDYPKALENFLNGARHAESVDSLLYANILMNIGLVYKNMRSFDKALDYQQQALTLYKRTGQKQGEANALANLGTLYHEMGDAEKALTSYNASLALNNEIGNNRRIASNLVDIGVVYQTRKNYDTALDYFKRSRKLYEQTNDKENTAFALVKTVQIYLNAPSLVARDGSRQQLIFDPLRRAAEIAEASGSLQSQQAVWETMSDVFLKFGDHASALEAYKKHVAFRDSIYNMEKENEITRQEIQFEFEKRESLLKAEHDKKIAVAQAEVRRRETMEWSAAAIVISLIIAAVFGYSQERKRKEAEKKRASAEFAAQIADTEMKALRAQMNPHFIFNSLNAISNFIGSNKLDFADDYLTRFSKVIRMILENSEHREITLADDLKALELYIQIERMRLQNHFSYQINVDEVVDTENTLVPPLILQPFVENAIWHGVSKKEDDGGKIAISIHHGSDKLICVVEDNGPGRRQRSNDRNDTATKNGEKKSLGIRITQSRIDMLNKEGQAGAGIDFTDLPQGLRVTVSLPILQKF